MSAVRSIPEGYHSLTPTIVCKDAAQAIDFYKQAFEAKELGRMTGPGGKIGHAELQIGDSRLMLSDEFPGMASAPGPTPITSCSIVIYTDNVDAVFERAVKAGAKVEMPLQNQFWETATANCATPLAISGDWHNTWKTSHPRKWSAALRLGWRNLAPKPVALTAKPGSVRAQRLAAARSSATHLPQAELLHFFLFIFVQWPQPGRTAHSARIAVFRHNHRRVCLASEYVLLQSPGHVLIQLRHLRHSASQHNHIRIQQVDHLRQTARQPVFVTLQARRSCGVARVATFHNFLPA